VSLRKPSMIEVGQPGPHLSIVVLPFVSGDAEQDYFVDGVTESLTTDLSRIIGSFVIGRHTAFTREGSRSQANRQRTDCSICARRIGSIGDTWPECPTEA